MRTTLSSLFILALLAVSADEGRAQPAAVPTLADTAQCLERARHETDLLERQLDRLCIATPSPTAPVACYLEASRSLLLTDPQSIELCRCTATLAPVQCFRQLRDAERLTEQEMVALCSPTVTLGLRLDCTPIP
jgi:hypothetical protein